MVIVIDTNVLVSAALSDGVCRKVISEALLHHRVVVSDAILEEYLGVADRQEHADYRGAMLDLIEEIRRKAVVVEPTPGTFGLPDSDDEVFLSTAKAGGADLITGNTRDFTAPRYGPIKVFTPRAFLDRPP